MRFKCICLEGFLRDSKLTWHYIQTFNIVHCTDVRYFYNSLIVSSYCTLNTQRRVEVNHHKLLGTVYMYLFLLIIYYITLFITSYV
jgi:hypothetical protein